MFTNTGNLSFYMGVVFILLAFTGLLVTYWLVKNNSIEEGKLAKLVDLGKWFIASVAIVVGATIIGDGFKEREQDIKEIDVFDKYVTTVTEADGIEKRWLLAEYFSIVAPDGELRKSWEAYKTSIKPSLEEYRANKAKLADLSDKKEQTESDLKQIATLEKKTQALEQSLVAVPNNQTKPISQEWLIITGADATVEAARDELSKAKKISPDARIYKKGNMFRTVIPNFFSRREALGRLTDVQKTVNSGAYVVTSNGWCSNAQDNGDYSICN